MLGLVLGVLLGFTGFAVVLYRTRIPGIRRLASHKPFAPFTEWTAQPHRCAPFPVRAGQRLAHITREVGPTRGMLVITTWYSSWALRDWRPNLRVARPAVPVVYVDDKPVSWGWGQTAVSVPPGEHVLAVSSSCSGWWQRVSVEAGQHREFHFSRVLGADAPHCTDATGRHSGVWFGMRRPGADEPFTVTTALAAGLGVMVATVALLVGIAAGLGDSFPVLGVVSCAVISFGICLGGWVVGMVLQDAATPLPPLLPAKTLTSLENGHRRRQAHVMNATDTEPPPPAPGWATVQLDLRFEFPAHSPADLVTLARLHPSRWLSPWQRWRAARIGEPERPGIRPWVPPPLVTIDDTPIQASWTRMWLQLRPGEHRIAVSVQPPQDQLGPETRLDLEHATRTQLLHLAPGQTGRVSYTATIDALAIAQRFELESFTARLL